MGLVAFLLFLVNYLWCVAMPLIGTLHLISSMYKEENKGKSALMRHWCYYWLTFAAFHLALDLFNFLPAKVMTIMYIIRVLLLSVMATPVLPVTSAIFDFLQRNGAKVFELKDWVVNWVKSFFFSGSA